MTEHGATDGVVVVSVVRTGGVAGIRREWRVVPPASTASRWTRLVEGCPWDAALDDDRGADRYQWHLDACVGERELSRTIPDGALRGPWRALVDAVRAHAAADDDDIRGR